MTAKKPKKTAKKPVKKAKKSQKKQNNSFFAGVYNDIRGKIRSNAANLWAKRPSFWQVLRFSALSFVWIAILSSFIAAYFLHDLPELKPLPKLEKTAKIIIYDNNNALLADYEGAMGEFIPFKQIPKSLIDAVIATEDRRFFSHFGIDIWGIMRAAYANWRAGKVVEGGSTITQQLVKNQYLTPEKSIRRKVHEAVLSILLERKMSKVEILEYYLNSAYFGSGTYGIEAASQKFFRKNARMLDLQESAILAGLLKAPSRLSPVNNIAAANMRADEVLRNMVKAGFFEQDVLDFISLDENIVHKNDVFGGGQFYFTDWILNNFQNLRGTFGDSIIIHTTLDSALQKKAQKAVAEGLELGKKHNANQAAMVVMAHDGRILAMVGGADYRHSQFNRAVQLRRQAGSVFKFFVFLAAFEHGMQPFDRFVDKRISIGKWSPENYKGQYFGEVSLEDAFAKSLNSVAVQLQENVGRSKVIAAAKKLGVFSPLHSHASLALGTNEMSLLELTRAFAAVANGGYLVDVRVINNIKSEKGRVLYQNKARAGDKVLSAEVVSKMDMILRAVVNKGTGRAAGAGAGKTGTTQNSRDAWFVGYDDKMVIGIWVGNDDDQAMKDVSGGTIPAMIWRKFVD